MLVITRATNGKNSFNDAIIKTASESPIYGLEVAKPKGPAPHSQFSAKKKMQSHT